MVIPERDCNDDTNCKKLSEQSICDTTKNKCTCVDGYTFNSRENKCLPILTQTIAVKYRKIVCVIQHLKHALVKQIPL
jgi:hypothetical protein